VSPRAVVAPVVDAGTPTRDVPVAAVDVPVAAVDVPVATVDAGTVTRPDVGGAVDAGTAVEPDAGDETPMETDSGVGGEEIEETTGALEGGCSAGPTGRRSGVPGGLCVAALAVVASVRRRRRAARV